MVFLKRVRLWAPKKTNPLLTDVKKGWSALESRVIFKNIDKIAVQKTPVAKSYRRILSAALSRWRKWWDSNPRDLAANELLNKVYIWHPKMGDSVRTQKIDIHYRFVGDLDDRL